MDDIAQRRQVRKDGPIEQPKKLPAAFPDKFDVEQDQKAICSACSYAQVSAVSRR